MDVFIGLFTGDWDKMWGGIKKIAEAQWELIKLVVSTSLKAIISILKGMFGAFKDVGTALFNKIWDGAKEILGNMILWLPRKIAELIKSFTSAYGSARASGRGMFSAVWDGMKGIWSSIANWVSSKVAWLTDKLAFWRKGSSEMNSGGSGGNGKRANSFAVGTPFVSHDQSALIHKGEAIIPARYNPFTKGGHFKPELLGQESGTESNYKIDIHIDRVESSIDIEKAVEKGIERADNRKKREIRKKGI